ncbi:MAG: toll/interleukin-1 receptor domain-containing protein [Planctomycetes bacterium]|nr:toll/interleukin-1 receptor domain-containing protein [Planctomycetota bacterium]
MPSKFHVFLSHNSADKPAVEEIGRRLKEDGLESWFDKWHLIPGEPWQPAIEQALADSATVAVFVGPSGFSPWQNEEMRAALSRRISQSDGQFRVIPVLLPGGAREERTRLPTFLVAATWVEYRRSIDEDDAYHRLKAGIQGYAPGVEASSKYEGQCPYRGLQAFQPEHAPFFFGREARIEWLLNSLRPASTAQATDTRHENRFLGIIGASGSGKSSLARAGLIPALRRGRLEGSDGWPIVICRPGQDPLESLAVALAADSTIGSRVGDVGDLMSRMQGDETRLHLTTRLALANAPETQRIVVVVDQFEEVFTLQSDNSTTSLRSSRSMGDLGKIRTGETRRKAFIDNLIYAAGIPGGKTIVVLTMRADFYGKCASFPNLAAALTDHQDLVGPMIPAELREVIERPAQLVGLELESGLTEVLLKEMEDQPGALPLLQHALWELWQRRDGRRLTLAAYQGIGGLEGALEKQANEIFEGLNPDDQATCRRIFLRLTQPGEGSEDTKRRVAVSQLGDSDAVASVIQRLTNVRLITAEGQSKSGSEAFVEVSHEALIRSWSKLRKWIDSDREALRTMNRLSEASTEWVGANRDPGYLFHGARLAEAEEWAKAPDADLNQVEREFLTASLDLRDRDVREEEARRTRELDTANKLADSERQRAQDQTVAARRSKRLSMVAMGLAAMAVVTSVIAYRAAKDARFNAAQTEVARQQIETTLANNLIERIHRAPDTFGVNEYPGIWQIAELSPDHEPLRKLVLSNGLADPESAARLANRAPQVALAIIGLDRDRRDRAINDAIVPLMKQPNAELPRRLAAARLGIALDYQDVEFAKQAVKALSEALVQAPDSRSHAGLTSDLKMAIHWIPSAELQTSIGQIVAMMEKTDDPQVLQALCESIAELKREVSLTDGRRMADRLVAVMDQQRMPDPIHILSSSLATLPVDLEVVDSHRVVKYLIHAIENTGNPGVQSTLVEAVQSTSDRLDPAECNPAAEIILKAMSVAEDSESMRALAQCLTAVTTRLATASSPNVPQAIQILLTAMQATNDAEPLQLLTQGLCELPGTLSRADIQIATKELLRALDAATSTQEMKTLAVSLAQLPGPLANDDLTRATSKLLANIHDDALPPDLYELCRGLDALPGKLSMDQSQKAMKSLLTRLQRASKSISITGLGAAMKDLGHKLDQQSAAVITPDILNAMKKTQSTEKILALSSAMVGIQSVVTPKDIEDAYAIVLNLMHDDSYFLPIDLCMLAQSMSVLPGITPEAVADKAIRRLLDAMAMTANSDAVSYLVEGLGYLGGNISAVAGHKAIIQVLKTIQGNRETGLWRAQALGLASLAHELVQAQKFDPSDASESLKQLAYAIDVTVDPDSLQQLARALASVGTILPENSDTEASRIAINQILRSVQFTHDPAVITMLAHCWEVMAGRMTLEETHTAFIQILAANRNQASVAARPALCHAAVALAVASQPTQTLDALEHLLDALSADLDPDTLEVLLNGIKQLAPRIPQSGVDRARSRIIGRIGTLDRLTDPLLLGLISAFAAFPEAVETVELVELLKCPFCMGQSRQYLLTLIETKTRISVDGDVWKLVSKAGDAGIAPELFKRPAKRPSEVAVVHDHSSP